jgi:hypothetical protein
MSRWRLLPFVLFQLPLASFRSTFKLQNARIRLTAKCRPKKVEPSGIDLPSQPKDARLSNRVSLPPPEYSIYPPAAASELESQDKKEQRIEDELEVIVSPVVKANHAGVR